MLLEAAVCWVFAIQDGDSLKVRCQIDGEYIYERVRLSAIDAPERKQPYGTKSKQALSDLCYDRQAKVTPVTRDRWKRLVADVECQNKDVATHMVSTGMAVVYDKYAKDYQWLYKHQDKAKKARTGLWADPHQINPWEWRKR